MQDINVEQQCSAKRASEVLTGAGICRCKLLNINEDSAVSFGIKACSAKYRVLFMSAQKLIEDLMLSLKDGTITQKLLAYSRLNLLIIDELGYMPITKEQANLLFQLVSVRYERGSIILTSNYNFEDWGQIFQDNVVAAAIIDRLVHHAKIFFINGSSYRLKSKLEKKKN